MERTQEITDILRSLGSTKANKGRQRTAAAIALAAENEDRLAAVNRDIYAVVGRAFHCKGSAVEWNIRTVSQRAWKKRRRRLAELARYDLDGPPSAAEFLEIVATHLLRQAGRWPGMKPLPGRP